MKIHFLIQRVDEMDGDDVIRDADGMPIETASQEHSVSIVMESIIALVNPEDKQRLIEGVTSRMRDGFTITASEVE